MKHISRVAAIVTTTVLGLSGLTACSSSPDSSSSAPSSAPSSSAAASPSESPSEAKAVTITIKDFKYSGPSSIAPGTKITVKNEDTAAHTVTADSGGAFDVQVTAGASKSFTAPSKAGSYKFHCTYHSNMHGMLKVS